MWYERRERVLLEYSMRATTGIIHRCTLHRALIDAFLETLYDAFKVSYNYFSSLTVYT